MRGLGALRLAARGPRLTGAITVASPRPDAGFTLLEVLVAVAILAALAALIPRSIVSARTSIEQSRDWLEAQLVAESVLNQELAASDLRPGTLTGALQSRQWRAELRPSRLPVAEANERILLDIRVSVAVSPGSVLELDTIRIGQPR
jgi:general secretion pathway protein I